MDIDKIIKEAELWNIKLLKRQALLIQKYFDILLYYNKKFNLTRITEPQKVLEELFFDSYAGFFNGLSKPGNELLDLGTGAGFPGLPIKIYMPDIKLYLLDSKRKKILFLQKVVEKLDLENVFFIYNRAEDYGRGDGREKNLWVTARAFAPLNIAAEIALPMLQIGGYFWAFKGPDFKKELKDAEEIIKRCGGSLENIINYTLPHAKKERSLIVIKKVIESENRFPRKAGILQKRPFNSKNTTEYDK